MKVKLEDVCINQSSNLIQRDIEYLSGDYPVFGAAGFIKNIDSYKQEKEYIAIVKDGAGVGRTMLLPAKSSVIGTLQYLLPKENIDIGYLNYALIKLNLAKYASGATIPHIYFKDYKKEVFELPELDEQKKVVSTLDRVSHLLSLRHQQLEKLDLLVKSQFIEMFGDIVAQKNSWETKTLAEVSKVGSSKRIYQNEMSQEGVPFLRIPDILNLTNSEILKPELFISEQHYDSLYKSGLVPKENDVLITSRGTIGKCYIVRKNDKFYFQDGMITWISELNKIIPLYLVYLFQMPEFIKQIKTMQAGSTVSYLSITMIKKLKLTIPPIDLQNKFAAFVQQVDKSKFVIKQSIEKLELLKSKLMQDYFG